jgi:hypothetical protein
MQTSSSRNLNSLCPPSDEYFNVTHNDSSEYLPALVLQMRAYREDLNLSEIDDARNQHTAPRTSHGSRTDRWPQFRVVQLWGIGGISQMDVLLSVLSTTFAIGSSEFEHQPSKVPYDIGTFNADSVHPRKPKHHYLFIPIPPQCQWGQFDDRSRISDAQTARRPFSPPLLQTD